MLATLLLSQGVPMMVGEMRWAGRRKATTMRTVRTTSCRGFAGFIDEGRSPPRLHAPRGRAAHKHPLFRRLTFFRGRAVGATWMPAMMRPQPDGGEMSDEEWSQATPAAWAPTCSAGSERARRARRARRGRRPHAAVQRATFTMISPPRHERRGALARARTSTAKSGVPAHTTFAAAPNTCCAADRWCCSMPSASIPSSGCLGRPSPATACASPARAPSASAVVLYRRSRGGQPMSRFLDGGWYEHEAHGAGAGALPASHYDGGSSPPIPRRASIPTTCTARASWSIRHAFAWTDAGWRGRPWYEAVVYELHVGTFSPEGTFAGVAARLDHPSVLCHGDLFWCRSTSPAGATGDTTACCSRRMRATAC